MLDTRMQENVIAIDGPAASGKSTIAQLVAQKLGIYYINTGNMYRAVALIALEEGIDLSNANDTTFEKLRQKFKITYEKGPKNTLLLTINSKAANLKKIRSHEISEQVRYPSNNRIVREWLVKEQREMVKLGTILMEGRDIGTNVFPNAKYKFFLSASPEVRAKRRLNQSGEVLSGATIESIAKEIALRDKLDMSREIAPLKKADDAITVDSSNMTINEVVDFIINYITSARVRSTDRK